jgi:photosystem II stability/assembly factor-like uncharacterized protein
MLRKKSIFTVPRSLLAAAFLSYFVLGQGQGFTIQVAATITEAEATALITHFKSIGVDAYLVIADVPGKGTRYRVRIGRFNTLTEAKSVAEKSRSGGQIKEFFVTAYEPPTILSVKPTPTQPPPQPKEQTPEPKEVEKVRISSQRTLRQAALPLIEIADPVVSRSSSVEKATKDDLINFDVEIGNNNWRVVKPGSATEKNLRSLCFVDALTGWAAGEAGSIYRTADGGREWKQFSIDPDVNINLIHFVDWNYGWMIGDLGKDESGGSTVLLSTANGGRSWTRQPLPHVESIFFTDLKTGWAAGRDATMLRTNDGGEHWSAVQEPEKVIGLPVESSNYNFGFREVFFLDKNNGWLIGNFYGRTQNNIGGLFVTSDGGQSWMRVPLTFQTQYSSGRFIPGSLQSVRFRDLQTGTLTGEMYDGDTRFFFVLHTRDGGNTWEQYRTPSRAVLSANFPDISHGWIAAVTPREGGKELDTTLMRTETSGLTWQNDLVARGRRINNIFFISQTRGWAVGDRGLILRFEKKN